jgi:hypothetical protein
VRLLDGRRSLRPRDDPARLTFESQLDARPASTPQLRHHLLRNALSYFDRALTDLALPIQKAGRAMHEKTPEPSR